MISLFFKKFHFIKHGWDRWGDYKSFLVSVDCFYSIFICKPLVLFYCIVFWFISFKKRSLLSFIGYLNCTHHLTTLRLWVYMATRLISFHVFLPQLIRCACICREKYCSFENVVFGQVLLVVPAPYGIISPICFFLRFHFI